MKQFGVHEIRPNYMPILEQVDPFERLGVRQYQLAAMGLYRGPIVTWYNPKALEALRRCK